MVPRWKSANGKMECVAQHSAHESVLSGPPKAPCPSQTKKKKKKKAPPRDLSTQFRLKVIVTARISMGCVQTCMFLPQRAFALCSRIKSSTRR